MRLNPNVTREVKFTLDDGDGTVYRVTAVVWNDDSVTIDAEYTDSITNVVVTMEELICDDTIPTVQDILDAIDADHERRYDNWLDSQYG